MPAALQVRMNDSPELYVVRVLFTWFCNSYFCVVNSDQQLAYGGTPEIVFVSQTKAFFLLMDETPAVEQPVNSPLDECHSCLFPLKLQRQLMDASSQWIISFVEGATLDIHVQWLGRVQNY